MFAILLWHIGKNDSLPRRRDRWQIFTDCFDDSSPPNTETDNDTNSTVHQDPKRYRGLFGDRPLVVYQPERDDWTDGVARIEY